MSHGTHDFANIDLGPQLTPERAAAIRTSAGVSFGDILSSLSAAMAAVTANMDPLVRALTVQTTNEQTEPETTGGFQVQYGSEYAVAMPQVSEELTHLLPIRKMDIATQFTEEFLDNADMTRLNRRFDLLSDGFRIADKVLTLDTLFNPTAAPVTENSVETSPKFIGFSSSDPYNGKVTLPDGTVITSAYSHYIRDTSANLATAIDTAIGRLSARGVVGPFDIVPSPDAADLIAGLDNFVDAGDALVRPGGDTDEALVDANVYIGVLRGKNVRVRRPEERILDDTGQAWFAMVKTYGENAVGNPLALRYSERYGLTPRIRSRSLYPLDYATAIRRVGFGVNNRFGAVLVKVASSGDYTAPQIRGN